MDGVIYAADASRFSLSGRDVARCIRRAWRAHGSDPRFLGRSLLNIRPALGWAAHPAVREAYIVHAHFAGVPSDLAQTLSLILNRPYSVSVHAWDLFGQPATRVSATIGRPAFVACCTEAGRERCLTCCPSLDPSNAIVARHGLDPADFPFTDTADARTILAVGRLVEKKGFEHLIAACANMRRAGHAVEAVIVGDGPLRRRLRDQINEAGLAESIRLSGCVAPARVKALLQSAALLAVPSVVARDGDRDGLPNVILEAMACGLPVVASDAGAIREAVHHGETGLLVPAADPSALANALTPLLRDAELRGRLGQAGRRLVEKDYNAAFNTAAIWKRLKSASGTPPEKDAGAGGPRR